MANASLSIQILPQVSEKEKVIAIVDKIIDYIKSTGLEYMVCPYETTIDGDFDTLMDVFAQCQRICVDEGSPFCLTYAKIWYRPVSEGVWSIDDKVGKYHK
ncbi:MAG: thiamine-binding protein [Clostridia bacterium]|nr:thiamine-binding protein [Clostridia bacterium]